MSARFGRKPGDNEISHRSHSPHHTPVCKRETIGSSCCQKVRARIANNNKNAMKLLCNDPPFLDNLMVSAIWKMSHTIFIQIERNRNENGQMV